MIPNDGQEQKNWSDLLAKGEEVPVTAGVVVETIPGAVADVAARLAALDGVEIVGSDDAQRIACVWQASDARTLVDVVEKLVIEDEQILGVFPTFFGRDDG